MGDIRRSDDEDWCRSTFSIGKCAARKLSEWEVPCSLTVGNKLHEYCINYSFFYAKTSLLAMDKLDNCTTVNQTGSSTWTQLPNAALLFLSWVLEVTVFVVYNCIVWWSCRNLHSWKEYTFFVLTGKETTETLKRAAASKIAIFLVNLKEIINDSPDETDPKAVAHKSLLEKFSTEYQTEMVQALCVAISAGCLSDRGKVLADQIMRAATQPVATELSSNPNTENTNTNDAASTHEHAPDTANSHGSSDERRQ